MNQIKAESDARWRGIVQLIKRCLIEFCEPSLSLKEILWLYGEIPHSLLEILVCLLHILRDLLSLFFTLTLFIEMSIATLHDFQGDEDDYAGRNDERKKSRASRTRILFGCHAILSPQG